MRYCLLTLAAVAGISLFFMSCSIFDVSELKEIKVEKEESEGVAEKEPVKDTVEEKLTRISVQEPETGDTVKHASEAEKKDEKPWEFEQSRQKTIIKRAPRATREEQLKQKFLNITTVPDTTSMKMVSDFIDVTKKYALIKKGKMKPERGMKLSDYKRKASAHVDYWSISRKSLAKHWKKRTKKERRRFVRLLRNLIETVAFPYAERYKEGELTMRHSQAYEKAKIAKIDSMFSTKKRDVYISFLVKRTGPGKPWRLYDIMFEEESQISNFQSQFNSIIHKKSYSALVRKIKRKIASVKKKERKKKRIKRKPKKV